MKLLYSFTLLFFIFSSFAQTTENDQEQIKKTNVQSITIMGASLDEFGKASPIRSKKEYLRFNTKGQLTQEIVYDAQSAIVTNTSYLYNQDNAVSKYLTKDASGNTVKRQQCTYENGLKISCKGVDQKDAFELTYKYDSLNNQVYRKKILNKTTIDFECFSTFEGNNLIKDECNGKPQIHIQYTYDSTQKLISKSSFANDELSYTFSYTYNDDSQLIKEEKYDANGVMLEKFIYDYIDKKLIKSISKYNKSGYLVMLWKYYYDEKSNVQFIKIYEGEAKTPLYQSEYLYKYHQ